MKSLTFVEQPILEKEELWIQNQLLESLSKSDVMFSLVLAILVNTVMLSFISTSISQDNIVV